MTKSKPIEIFIQADKVTSSGVVAQSKTGDAVKSLTAIGEALGPVMELVRSAATRAHESWKGIEADELTVNFGVSVGAESNALIVKATGQGTFSVSMKWSKPTARQSPS